jgi:hypothetical protein
MTVKHQRTRASDPVAPPSIHTLAKTTVAAMSVAAVLLVTCVLPAEYGIDPTGVGRRLGLTEIASPTLKVAEPLPSDSALAPVVNGPVGLYPTEFKFDVFEVVLPPYEYIEYKYQLEKGASMLYSWQASAAVIHDFHGEHSGAVGQGTPEAETYDKQQRQQASGSLTAPFTGIHGWYWENPGGSPITIRVTSSGYYASSVEIHSDHTRRVHMLRPANALPLAPDPPATAGGE